MLLLFGAGMYSHQSFGTSSGPTPMEIGNFEQKRNDRRNNACFKCHKVGCRSWICDESKKKDKTRASIGNSNANSGVGSAGHQAEN